MKLVIVSVAAAMASLFLYSQHAEGAPAKPKTKSTAKTQALLCNRPAPNRMADGRLLNHLPYKDSPEQVIDPPKGFNEFANGAKTKCSYIHPDIRTDLEAMIAASNKHLPPGDGLVGVSCTRTIKYQTDIATSPFCRGLEGDNFQKRALTSAPPGFSEHHTGYTIDFGLKNGTCSDPSACFGDTKAGRWLRQCAHHYGFEMSFPEPAKKNPKMILGKPVGPQGVSYEPWHYRWVGRSKDAAGASKARNIFRKARDTYPAAKPVTATPPFDCF